MAITGSYSTSTGVNLNLVAYYSYTQNIDNATSEVTVTLKLRHRSLRAIALSGSYLSVAGNQVNYSKTFSKSDNTEVETTLATKTITINHNNETGQGSCKIKGTFVFNGTYGGKYIGTLTIDETLTLQTIPRASGFSVPSSINTGSSLTLTITPASATFKHKVQFKIGSTTKYTSDFISADTKTYSYTIPHSWFPSSTSGSIVVYLFTYNSDGTYVASTYKSITANVPSSIIPTISSVNATVVNGLNSRYVQGKSSVKISVTADSDSGSSLNLYTIKGESLSYSGSSSTVMSGVIQNSGTFVYTVTVSDKRGRTSEPKTVSITVQPYSTPRVAAMTVERCSSDGTLTNDGTYAKVSVDVAYSPIDGQNTLEVYLSSNKDNYGTVQQILTQDSGTTTYTGIYGSEFLTSENYIIKATIADYYITGLPMSAILRVAMRPFNMSKYNNGIAIGGFSSVSNRDDKGLFECYWDADFKKDIWMGGVRGQTTQQNLKFSNPDDSTYPTYCALYGGDPNSTTDIGIWDALNNRGVFRYESSTDDNNGVFYIPITSCVNEIFYNSDSDSDETNLNNWLTEKLRVMPDDSLMPCKICCYPAVSDTTYSGFLFKHSDKYAHFCGQDYFGETFYKPLQNGVWSNTTKYSYSSINNKLNSLENRHINEFSSISVNDIDKPSNWGGYGRVLRWGSPSSSDKYYLLIDSNGKLFTGIQLNGASTVTWYEK